MSTDCTLKEARAIRDFFRARGFHSVAPTGYAPWGYFARIYVYLGAIEVRSMKEARDVVARVYRDRRSSDRYWSRKRSSIAVTVERAAGGDAAQGKIQ